MAATQHACPLMYAIPCVLCNTYGKPRTWHTSFYVLASCYQWYLQGSIQRHSSISSLAWRFNCSCFSHYRIKRKKRDSEPQTLPTFDFSCYNENYWTRKIADWLCTSGLLICFWRFGLGWASTEFYVGFHSWNLLFFSFCWVDPFLFLLDKGFLLTVCISRNGIDFGL